MLACAAVWAETAAVFGSEAPFHAAMRTLDIGFSECSETAAFRAGQVWRQYRAAGGSRKRIATDFLIGAHALSKDARLLTRDSGFYRDYFKGLEILDPTQGAA